MLQSTPSANPTRDEFRYTGFENYILGGFGSDLTHGLDILRLAGPHSSGNYRQQPDTPNWNYDIPLLLPELFGGGNGDNNPYFPYHSSEEGKGLYFGAPDGLPDGVIIVYKSDGTSINF